MTLIKKLDETFVEILSNEPAILKEIADKFSFQVPNFLGDYRFKMGIWDGKKSLFNTMKRTLYVGLVPKLIKWLNSNNYDYKLDSDLSSFEFSLDEGIKFIASLNLPFEPKDYQIKYFVKSVRERRLVCISPTSSGKSLIIYMLFRYFNKKTLLVVPSLSLILQLKSDFEKYGLQNSDNIIHAVTNGMYVDTQKQLTIVNYHAIAKCDSKFFHDFEVVLGDEAHSWKAETLVSIMKKCCNSKIKIGFTGTTTGNEYSDHTIEGLFGPLYRFITTKDMMDRGDSSKLLIEAIVLNHQENPYRNLHLENIDYQTELDYLATHDKRNKFIKNLALSLKGNIFIMFKTIEQGKRIYELIKDKANCPVYYVDGQTSVNEREEIRLAVEQHENSITICSTVFATGINITTINSIIFASPSKSRVRVLQSIGRGLRKGKNKYNVTLFDIADDICRGKTNHTLNHFKERVKLYNEEKFDYKFHLVNI